MDEFKMIIIAIVVIMIVMTIGSLIEQSLKNDKERLTLKIQHENDQKTLEMLLRNKHNLTEGQQQTLNITIDEFLLRKNVEKKD